ncbi:MAG TPA: metallophosphoesterase family protein [Thermoanaerobaculia bacterium]|nr:metallophosphoesterase family protein [Thermoanaerobaculia bacterium]
MRILALSDVHSNLSALQAVFRAVQRKRIDLTVCLGDLVGYGAQPNQVLERLRRRRGAKSFVRGNHDRVALGGDLSGFNQVAREAALWTRSKLSPENRRFLAGLPHGPLVVHGVTLVHGSALDEDEYLFTAAAARRSFEVIATPIAMFGHTHLPTLFRLGEDGSVDGAVFSRDAEVRLEPGSRYLLNPGSVGQPRDRNPEAAFAIVDLARLSVRFRRVAYDVSAAQRAIRKAGLPGILADRLAAGY